MLDIYICFEFYILCFVVLDMILTLLSTIKHQRPQSRDDNLNHLLCDHLATFLPRPAAAAARTYIQAQEFLFTFLELIKITLAKNTMEL